MATTLRDWHVALVDEDGDPINSGNPLPVTGTIAGITGTVDVRERPATSGGASVSRNLDTGTTGTVAKASAGQVYGYYFSNAHASDARFLKLYDKATAATVGDTPLMTLRLPFDSGGHVFFGTGVEFDNGIGYRATTGVADADTGAPGSNEVIINLLYS